MLFRLSVLCIFLVTAGVGVAEVSPAAAQPCFPGAIYRKAISSQDQWTGIEAIVTLPEFTPDPERTDPKTGRPLDNAWVYLGCRTGEDEIDAGVNWEVVKEPDGSISPARKAYRPFWRTDTWHSGPARREFYYYPGDRLRICVETLVDGKMQFSIELLERGEVGRVAEARYLDRAKSNDAQARNAWSTMPADAQTSITINFDAPGFGPGRIQEFKRSNAIDQFGNEGLAAVATSARVSEATWHEVWLLRGKVRLPMTPARFTDMRCPAAEAIAVEPQGDSGERVRIQ